MRVIVCQINTNKTLMFIKYNFEKDLLCFLDCRREIVFLVITLLAIIQFGCEFYLIDRKVCEELCLLYLNNICRAFVSTLLKYFVKIIVVLNVLGDLIVLNMVRR